MEKTKKSLTFQEKSENFVKELGELKTKYEIDFDIKMDFPEYKILPDDVKLAIAVIAKHKTNFVLHLIDKGVKDGINN